MSIWTDIIKYNKKHKAFINIDATEQGEYYQQTLDLNINQNSTSFIKFATLIPQLDGSISSVSVSLRQIQGGLSGVTTTIEIRDKNNNVIATNKTSTESTISFRLNVKAFQKYDLYFKNSSNDSGYSITVPKSVNVQYRIIQNSKYLTMKG